MVATGPVPAPGRCGIAAHPVDEVGEAVLAAWDAFLAVVEDPATDLSRPSRLPGWTGRDVLVHLGSWPDARIVDGLLASAAEGGAGTSPDPDATNDVLHRAHRDASNEQVVQALHDARDRLAEFFDSEAEQWGRIVTRSTVGPLPVLCLVHAGTFELAVHALDLAPCGAPPPDPLLLDRGLAALLDITGALAHRQDVDLRLTGTTPAGGWTFDSAADGWTTTPYPAGPLEGVGVRGTAVDLLEAASGRTNLLQLLVTRRLAVQQLPQWMRLAPLLEDVPGLPGGAALRGAVGGVSGVAGGLAGLAGDVTGAAGRALGRLGRLGR